MASAGIISQTVSSGRPGNIRIPYGVDIPTRRSKKGFGVLFGEVEH
jgi:hypothetical protein